MREIVVIVKLIKSLIRLFWLSIDNWSSDSKVGTLPGWIDHPSRIVACQINSLTVFTSCESYIESRICVKCVFYSLTLHR